MIDRATKLKNFYSYSTQLSMKISLLINMKIPTFFLLINMKIPTISLLINMKMPPAVGFSYLLAEEFSCSAIFSK